MCPRYQCPTVPMRQGSEKPYSVSEYTNGGRRETPKAHRRSGYLPGTEPPSLDREAKPGKGIIPRAIGCARQTRREAPGLAVATPRAMIGLSSTGPGAIDGNQDRVKQRRRANEKPVARPRS